MDSQPAAGAVRSRGQILPLIESSWRALGPSNNGPCLLLAQQSQHRTTIMNGESGRLKTGERRDVATGPGTVVARRCRGAVNSSRTVCCCFASPPRGLSTGRSTDRTLSLPGPLAARNAKARHPVPSRGSGALLTRNHCHRPVGCSQSPTDA